ncbi:hypothetical protein OE858_001029 [Escherichia coli]|nr:hypothetical protein [Escherichia coli]
MFARCVYSDTACFTVGELYSVDLLNGCKRGAGCIYYVKDNDGDSRTLDLDSDDFEYIPPVTYRDVDDFLVEQEDEDDD